MSLAWLSPLLPVASTFFLSSAARAMLGFGDALIAMPLLVLAVGLQTAAPLVALVALVTSLSILVQTWRDVHRSDAWRLILSSLAGIPFGLLLLKAAPEPLVKAALGVLLVGFGLYKLLQPRMPAVAWRPLVYLSGFVAGVLGGAYNTNGPPVVVYGALRGWSPERFRGTLQLYFLTTGMMVAAGHGLAGLWTREVWRLFAIALPAVALGLFLGGRVSGRIPAELFNKLVYAFLIVAGLLLVV